MTINCPYCSAPIDIGDKEIGQRVHHARCNNWVLIGRNVDGMRYGVKVQAPVSYPREKKT